MVKEMNQMSEYVKKQKKKMVLCSQSGTFFIQSDTDKTGPDILQHNEACLPIQAVISFQKFLLADIGLKINKNF